MRAGAVAARDKGILAVGDGLEGGLDILSVLHAGGIRGGTAEHKVVVHPVQALRIHAVDHTGEALVNESLFLLLGVDEDQIGVAHLGVGDGLAGAGGINLDLVAVFILEDRQQVAEQAGVVDGGGGGQADQFGILGGFGNPGIGDGAVFLQIEQVLAIFLEAVVGGQRLALLGEKPVDESIRTHGVQLHILHFLAVGIHKRGVGVYGQQAVVVDHGVIGFFKDAGIDHEGVLFLFLVRGQGRDRSQREDHDQGQQQRYDLFHVFPPM